MGSSFEFSGNYGAIFRLRASGIPRFYISQDRFWANLDSSCPKFWMRVLDASFEMGMSFLVTDPKFWRQRSDNTVDGVNVCLVFSIATAENARRKLDEN